MGKSGESKNILCGASYYEKKFYLNERYNALPSVVKEELQIMCVRFVEEVSGIIMLEFDKRGNLRIVVTSREDDFYFDNIGSELLIKRMQDEKRELFEQLEEYYAAIG